MKDLSSVAVGDNVRYFSEGAETKEQCEEMLGRPEGGETGVSYRNRIPLRLDDPLMKRGVA